MIRVQDLTYDYADKRALEEVSFEIAAGSITALVGPNGSGKTTLLRCLAALSRPLKGSISICSFDALEEPREVHRQVGYLQDLFGLYDELTVYQALQFTAHSRLEREADIGQAIARAAERAGVKAFIGKKIATLSRGMRQRVGIAQAIIHQPQVLLLDEPASGLDPEARYALSHLLLELRDAGMTILVSSHILAELEDYSSAMLVIQDGRILEHRQLRGQARVPDRKVLLYIRANGFSAEQAAWMQSLPGLQLLSDKSDRIELSLDEDQLPRRLLLRQLIGQGLAVEEFAEVRSNLQEEYIRTLAQYKQNAR